MNLHHLFVAPGARCAGIGRTLIRAAEAEARAQGCVRLVVGIHPDTNARNRTIGCRDSPTGRPEARGSPARSCPSAPVRAPPGRRRDRRAGRCRPGAAFSRNRSQPRPRPRDSVHRSCGPVRRG
ncbi:GNAT family N-acetyltransferase [Methylobacterium ajmalii]|uniref:GNAT family N-acetyltransferase n=1 Tax=Methylobacterium TaxID=407 RepID=UPI0038B2FB27